MQDPSIASNSRAVPFGLDDLNYDLPRSLIAQQPPRRRDEARLLVLPRDTDRPRDGTIRDLPALLREGDLLVLNDTKVIPAKFHARRDTGGKVEGLFLSEASPRHWRIMLRGSRRLSCGQTLTAGRADEPGISFTLIEHLGDGQWLVCPDTRQSPEAVLERIGETPLPPYIHRCNDEASGGRQEDEEDRARYQTIYARHAGSIAAPTAGLHFTHALLERIRKRGIETTTVTLHVGIATFKPIKVMRIQEHRMLPEHFEITDEAAQAVARCRARGGRVVAVGTTTVRTLEAARCDGPVDRGVRPVRASTDLFIFPPYRFRVVDVLLTNFHLPGSTLLALVMAFADVDRVRRAYRHAVEAAYRFYSYGDAMLIT